MNAELSNKGTDEPLKIVEILGVTVTHLTNNSESKYYNMKGYCLVYRSRNTDNKREGGGYVFFFLYSFISVLKGCLMNERDANQVSQGDVVPSLRCCILFARYW